MSPQTFQYTGSAETFDVSDAAIVEAIIDGASGEAGNDSFTDGGEGGPGGRLEVRINVNDLATLRNYVGGGNGETWGYNSGGLGATDGTSGGNGAGETSVRDENDNRLAASDGGGGGGGGSASNANGSGGGGGAAGGVGGSSATGADGEDAEGTGNGGDGGRGYPESAPSPGDPGDPGGATYDSALVEVINEEVGGTTTADHGEITLEITLNAVETPESLTATATSDTRVFLQWTEPGDGEDARIYRSTDPNVEQIDSNLIGTVAAGAESFTDTGLDQGTEYYYAVSVAWMDDETGLSNETAVTTEIPQIDGLILDGTEPQEMTAEWDAILDNGQYRLRWKRAENASYDPTDEATITVDSLDPLENTVEYTMTGLLDGEKYDIGLRTETDDVSGDWFQLEEITKLIPADQVVTSTADLFSLSISWQVNSEFDGSQQIWRRRVDYRDDYYDDPKGELLATVDTTTNTFDDPDELTPQREYVYTIRSITQYVYSDGAETLETASAGLAQTRSGSQGWHAEIDHPSGQTITPQILDDATIEPRLNEQPRIRIPVPRDESFLSEPLEGATVRVFKDGREQPVDEVEDVELQEDRTVLICVGGVQLERDLERDVGIREAHDLVTDLIAEETDYVANVDDPDITSLIDELLSDASDTASFEELFSGALGGTDPFNVADDSLQLAKTNYMFEATDFVEEEGLDFHIGADFTDTTGRTFSSPGDYGRTETFTLPYQMPADGAGLFLRATFESDAVAAEVSVVDAESDSTVGTLTVVDTSGESEFPGWWSAHQEYNGVLEAGGEFWDEQGYGDIDPGEYYLEVTAVDSDANNNLNVDLVALIDTRFDYNFANADEDNELAGPQPYPDEATIQSNDIEQIYSVRSANITADWTDTSGPQAIEASNDSGRTWIQAENSSSLDDDFDRLGNTVRVRMTASRWSPDGERNTTPTTGYASQEISNLEIRADMDDTALIINEAYEDNLGNVLADIAERSDSIWAVEQDGDQTTVEWCQPGQRTSDEAAALANYSITKHNKRTLKARVKGGAGNERETVTVEDGIASLSQRDVVSGTEFVQDVDTGDRFQYGFDYEIRNLAGEIDLLPGSNIDEGQDLEVEYEYKLAGEFEHDDYDGNSRQKTTVSIPGISNARACEMAAKILVDEASVPRWEATASIPPGDLADISLVEVFDLGELPGDRLVVYEPDISADGTELQLGSRDRVRDTVNQIQSTLESVSRRS